MRSVHLYFMRNEPEDVLDVARRRLSTGEISLYRDISAGLSPTGPAA